MATQEAAAKDKYESVHGEPKDVSNAYGNNMAMTPTEPDINGECQQNVIADLVVALFLTARG